MDYHGEYNFNLIKIMIDLFRFADSADEFTQFAVSYFECHIKFLEMKI
jgi:hypothetical protein